MSWPINPGLAATVDRRGTQSAEAFQRDARRPRTVNTAAIPTTGATGLYVLGNLVVTSTIDPSINDLGCRYCYSTRAGMTGRLKLLLLFPSFGQPPSEYSDDILKMIADFYWAATGHSFVVAALKMRGHGTVAGQDLARDSQDVHDIAQALKSTLGSLLWGSGDTFFAVGVSTGALNAAQAACRLTDHVNGMALIAHNCDIGRAPRDSYWGLGTSVTRSAVDTIVGARGDSAAGDLDAYAARDIYRAVGRVVDTLRMAVVIAGDTDETDAIPSVTRLAAACRSTPGGMASTQLVITNANSATRVLHSGCLSGNGGTGSDGWWLAAKAWAAAFLAVTEESAMPQESPPGGLGLLGWMRKRAIVGSSRPEVDCFDWQYWAGANAGPRLDSAGGRLHAGEITWRAPCREFSATMLATVGGNAEVLFDGDRRLASFSAGAAVPFDLNIAPGVANPVTDLGFTDAWDAGHGVTGTSTVTAWAATAGGLSFAASGSDRPALTADDGDGVPYIGFTAASYLSGQKMLLSPGALLVVPDADYTLAMVCYIASGQATAVSLVASSHHGSSAEWGGFFNSGSVYQTITLDNGTVGGPQTGPSSISTNAKHVVIWMRRRDASGQAWLYTMVDGGAWSRQKITSDATFTKTGTVSTSLAAAWADGGGAYWLYNNCRVYGLWHLTGIISDAGAIGFTKYAKDTFVIP